MEICPPPLELFEDLDAAEVGHAEVQQDQIRLELGATLEDLARVGRASQVCIADVLEKQLQEADHGGLVVHDQNLGGPKRLGTHAISLRTDLVNRRSARRPSGDRVGASMMPASLQGAVGRLKIWKLLGTGAAVRSRLRRCSPAGESERVVGLTVRRPNLTPPPGHAESARATSGGLVGVPLGSVRSDCGLRQADIT